MLCEYALYPGESWEEGFESNHGGFFDAGGVWERRIPADTRNRIPLALRCLLVEAPNALVLIDTGVGNKYGEKFGDIYGISNAGDPTRLEDAVRHAGFDPSDIDDIAANAQYHCCANAASAAARPLSISARIRWIAGVNRSSS